MALEHPPATERALARSLKAGDRIVMGDDVVALDAVMLSGERVWVRVDGETGSTAAGDEVERLT